MTTLIIVCTKCGNYLLAKAEQQTRTCPHCNSKITVTKAKKVASANNSYEASDMLRKLKNAAALRQNR
jgi:DNA-directed RNA polymerase subunit RPC12/RpoP